MLGISPNTGGINIEGMIRKGIGLPAFDEWEDYRIDRMLVTMASDGAISVQEARQAMIDRSGKVFLDASRRAGQQYSVVAMGSLIGIPAQAYPPGEERLRKLADSYAAAWKNYEETGDPALLNSFNEHNPSYEARLALWRSPEERLRTFLVDQIWDIYHNMPQLHKDELTNHLGELWQTAFLDKDTRSYQSISMDTLQVWLKIMGGDPPGKITYNENVTPLQFAPVDDAYRVEVFYNYREQQFDYYNSIFPLLQTYFQLEKGTARKAFLREHPSVLQYWDWRRDFMERNPSIAVYLTDDPENRPQFKSEADLLEAQALEAQAQSFTPEELQAFKMQTVRGNPELIEQLPDGPFKRLFLDEINGIPLPSFVEEILQPQGATSPYGGG